jgi:parvulin-like peptidyl-prolyl isomerase
MLESISEDKVPATIVIAIVLTSLLAGCRPEPDPIGDLPPIEADAPDPQRVAEPDTERPRTVSVSQIMCTYRGAEAASRRYRWNREQALQRCGHLHRLARSPGANFADLARRFSSDSETSMDGGDLGVVSPYQLHPAVERAAFALGMGQVSDLVESSRGFHILMRHPPTEAQAGEIAITFEGADEKYTARASRTYEQARDLAGQIRARIAGGAAFEEEALAHSDDPTHTRGGLMPIFRKGATRYPEFEEIVFTLPEGGLSEVIETPTGFHIVKRLPVRRIRVRHILIRFRPPTATEDSPLRSWSEAYLLTEELRERATARDADFALLADEHSDATGEPGGLLGPFGRGEYPLALDRAAFALAIGQVSGIVETETGFHLLKRVR